MITIVYMMIMLGLIVLPLLKTRKPLKPVYKRPDTDDACYAVNEQGYLEEIHGNKVSSQITD